MGASSTRRGLIGVGVAAVLLSSVVAGPPASADPRPSAYRPYVGVGSPSTSALWDGLSNGRASIDGGRPQVPSVASYDAITTPGSSGQIRTRSGGALFLRPGTNYDGAQALSSSNDAPYLFRKRPVDGSGKPLPRIPIPGQVDFARESARVTWAPGDDLTWMPFVRDAVSVVGRGLDPDLVNLTRAEIFSIYQCESRGNIRIVGEGRTSQIWYDNGTTVRQRLFPLLPRNSGDTIDFFQRASGFSGIASCVNTAYLFPETPDESDGRELTRPGEIVPFLVSAWIAQKNGMTTTTVFDPELRLLKVNGMEPTTLVNGSLVAGPLYGRSAVVPVDGPGVFWRDVYNVIDTSDVGSPLEQTLTGGVGSNEARYTINRFGFKNIDYLGDRSRYLTTRYWAQ